MRKLGLEHFIEDAHSPDSPLLCVQPARPTIDLHRPISRDIPSAEIEKVNKVVTCQIIFTV